MNPGIVAILLVYYVFVGFIWGYMHGKENINNEENNS